MRKVLIVGGGWPEIDLFAFMGFQEAVRHTEADLICFTGGSDVSPFLYGHKRHPSSYVNVDRDYREKVIYDQFVGKVPFVGICRGGQFLNVMNGGEMYQDVTDHAGVSHTILDQRTGEEVFVSSTHHQMMKPHDKGQIIAIAHEGGLRTWYNKNQDKFVTEKSNLDIEVVLYKDTKSLCFQPHPEYNEPGYEGMRHYFKRLVDEELMG